MAIEDLLAQIGPDALLVAREGTVVFANAASDALLVAPSGSLVGRTLDSLLGAGELARVETVFAQREQGLTDLPQTFRLRVVCDGGAEAVVDARFTRSGSDVVLSARDATEQVRAERLTGRLAELSRGGHPLMGADALLDAAEPVFVELEWRGAFTRLVPGGAEVLRTIACLPGDPIGEYARTLLGRVLPGDRTPVLQQVVAQGNALYLDNVPAFLTGPVSAAAPLSASLTRGHAYRSVWCPVRSGDGQLTHVLAMAGRGMTEHDFVALQLFAAHLGAAIDLAVLRARLVRRERLAAVGEMSAVLAHEVRNPLGVIYNVVAGLRPLVSGETGELLVQSLAEEAARLQRLMGDLLDFARPTVPALGPVALGPLLTEAVGAASVDVTLHEPPRVAPVVLLAPGMPEVRADAAMLRRAVLNLVLNALQHVSEGGGVEVKAWADGGRAHVRVYNDGVSLPDEAAEKIFEPFFTTRAAGAGLGLAVVRRVMEELGGTVAVERTDSGVAFVLSLGTLPGAALAS